MRRLTHEEVKEYFEKEKCKLLSETYQNNRQKLKYVCICGRESEITFDSFKQGQRCKDCYEENRRKRSYEDVKEMFELEGYKLETDFYKNGIQKLTVVCPNNHRYTTNHDNFKKGHRCRECKKPTIEEIRNEFFENNCILLSTEYKNDKSKLKYICCSCNKILEIRYHEFKIGQRCRDCGNKKVADLNRHSYEYIKTYFEEHGCILLSTKYNNSSELLDYICSCGNVSKIRFSSFKSGNRCKECGIKKVVDSRKYKYEQVKSFFEERGCILLSTDYVNNHQKLHYICSCGNEDWKQLYMFLQGQSCRECGLKKLSASLMGRPGLRGEDSPHWNPNKTMEERESSRSLPERYLWRKSVFEHDNYTCQCCGDSIGGNLNAHHLDGYDWCKVSRWNTDNGITLCNICHDDFHMVYGYGSNTREQFEEYMEGIAWNCVGIYKDTNLVI